MLSIMDVKVVPKVKRKGTKTQSTETLKLFEVSFFETRGQRYATDKTII